jgi:hypothetical protein
MTYNEFLTRYATALAVQPTDPSFVTYLPELIQDAEAMCYRELEPLAMQSQKSSVMVEGARGMNGPPDWLVGQDIWITVSGARQRLQQRDSSFLQDYSPDPFATGVPKYWTEVSFQTIEFAPTPNDAFPIEFYYTAQQVPLSNSNPITYLSQWLPDLFFAAAMVVGTGYQKNWGAQADDPKMALSWSQAFDRALSSAKNNEGRRNGEGFFTASPSRTPSTTG